MTLLILVIAAAILLLVAGLWIPFVVAGAAMALIAAKKGFAGLAAVGLVTWSSANSFTLTAIPLFILMAEILLQTGLATRLYRGLARVTRSLPGGLLQTNILGCALFSAISGSSVATAAAIGTVAVPELRSRGYPMPAAYGSLAAGGTLGILIPPSIALIVYGTFTETSIVRLFAAGMIPGLLLALLFSIYVGFAGRHHADAPQAIEQEASASMFLDIAPVVALIALVLSALYLGVATPTEAASLGSVLAVLLAMALGDLTRERLVAAFHRTVRSSATILFVVIAAFLFSFAMAISGVTGALTKAIVAMNLSPAGFLVAVAVVYLVLGLFIESIAMMVITVPLIAPAFAIYGIDPIWFGVFLVILIEIGQITPPFGLNLFVIQSTANARYTDVVRGAVPYYAILLAFLVLLAVVPGLALWLPGETLMFDPEVRRFTILSRMPDALRRRARSEWSTLALDGRPLDGFLEGPVTGPDGTLYMTDIPFGRILSMAPDGSWSVVAEYDGWPNGMKLSEAGFLVADHKRGLLEIGEGGSVRVLVDGFEGKPFHGLNDLTLASSGDIWFTDQGMSGLEAPIGRLFRYSGGALTLAMDGIPSPNGLVFSGDERTIYLAVTRDNAIWRLPLDDDGAIRKAGRFIRLSGGVGPDGLARGPDGDLMVVHAGLGIWRFSANGLPRTFWHDPRLNYPTNIAADPRSRGRYLITESLSCSVLCVDLEHGEGA